MFPPLKKSVANEEASVSESSDDEHENWETENPKDLPPVGKVRAELHRARVLALVVVAENTVECPRLYDDSPCKRATPPGEQKFLLRTIARKRHRHRR